MNKEHELSMIIGDCNCKVRKIPTGVPEKY